MGPCSVKTIRNLQDNKGQDSTVLLFSTFSFPLFFSYFYLQTLVNLNSDATVGLSIGNTSPTPRWVSFKGIYVKMQLPEPVCHFSPSLENRSSCSLCQAAGSSGEVESNLLGLSQRQRKPTLVPHNDFTMTTPF